MCRLKQREESVPLTMLKSLSSWERTGSEQAVWSKYWSRDKNMKGMVIDYGRIDRKSN